MTDSCLDSLTGLKLCCCRWCCCVTFLEVAQPGGKDSAGEDGNQETRALFLAVSVTQRLAVGLDLLISK